MRITLDTNVLISSYLTPDGPADHIVDLVRRGEIELVLSPFMLDELSRILARKFELSAEAVDTAIGQLQRIATIIEPRVHIDLIAAKEDDNRILECAVSGKVDYLVTGDKKHILPLKSIQGIPIVTVRQYVEILGGR